MQVGLGLRLLLVFKLTLLFLLPLVSWLLLSLVVVESVEVVFLCKAVVLATASVDHDVVVWILLFFCTIIF